jgi:hypothetical protein
MHPTRSFAREIRTARAGASSSAGRDSPPHRATADAPGDDTHPDRHRPIDELVLEAGEAATVARALKSVGTDRRAPTDRERARARAFAAEALLSRPALAELGRIFASMAEELADMERQAAGRGGSA